MQAFSNSTVAGSLCPVQLEDVFGLVGQVDETRNAALHPGSRFVRADASRDLRIINQIVLSLIQLSDGINHCMLLTLGASGTAAMIRRLRANLLDELEKQYVITARAKGLHPFRALIKYPLRMALNFFISDIGSILPSVVSGTALVAIVLSLPTTGPVLLAALQSQDMYLAGSFLMFLAMLTVVGVLLSDLALALLDPRIRLQGGTTR